MDPSRSDRCDAELLRLVHPPDWQNPTPPPRYDLVIVGGGSAGVAAAWQSAALGARTALVERHLLGGRALDRIAVPPAICAADQNRPAEQPGAPTTGDRALKRLHRIRRELAEHYSASRLTVHGIDVYFGQAQFSGRDVLDVEQARLRFRRAVIATGGRSRMPTIAGLSELDALESGAIFALAELPRRLIVLGAGPAGCELAQAFARLGSQVHLVDAEPRILASEDPAAAAIVQLALERDSVHLHLGWQSAKVEAAGPFKSLLIERGGDRQKLLVDQILVALDSRPNVEDLNLEAARIEYDASGIRVNARLRTTNRRIFAAGAVCRREDFAYAAQATARMAVDAALSRRRRTTRLVIPRCTYTDPELAQVGLTQVQAGERAMAIDSYQVDLADVDRSILDERQQGFAVVHTRQGTDKIVGATIVAPRAGEWIAPLTLLMTQGQPLARLAHMVACYPTQTEILIEIAQRCAGARPTSWLRRLLRGGLVGR